ncbi:MAG: T9SS type A sorting domain-containing protein [Ignavibacteriota bacterium]|nr:T9SS type A sorting domain-containing protein [Ignavibacteriota bacterium]
MKKLFTFFALVTTFLVLFNTTEAGDRMMLIEFFTSSTCGPCASNNPIMTAFMNTADPEKIAAIGFHMNWPAPGNDPMYLYNSTDNTTRRTYYGVNAIPAGFFDGIISVPLPYSQTNLQSYFDSRKNILSPVTIIVRDSTYGDSVLVRVNVLCETFLANPVVNMYMCVYEDLIHYASPPGTNGETDFHTVMRKMLPAGNGTQLILTPGYNKEFVFRYKMDPVWNASNIKSLVYIQGADKEILNAAKKLANFSLMTSKSFFSVAQGQAAANNFKVKIPYVASGFNSPVTFTSEIQPTNAGISVAFPSGTTISSFPDSLSVQLNSSAAVAAGTYKVILTGTSVSGKVHKVSVDLLVGKNYITVQANNPSLNIVVDNTTYLGASLFNWDINSSHTISAISPQTNGNTRYIFTNWSNSGDTSQTINVSSTTSLYTANYKTQFKLLGSVQPSGIPVTVTGANTFYDSSTTLTVSTTPFSLLYNGKTYYFNRWMGAGIGSYTGSNRYIQLTMTNPINQIAFYDTINTSITKLGSEIPSKYDLYQNYPNPFNPTTNIKFDIIRNGIVKLDIYDITGRNINSLVNGKLEAGKYEFNLNASYLPSGVYFYKLETENFTMTRRMVLLK